MSADKPIDPLLVPEAGHTECLLGNEAIVRGALEAGVAFASGYPGTPSSEVTDSFARISDSQGIVFEYSVNEKVALEMAYAASMAGARSICAMKHLGLMVAGDPLSTIPYIGVRAGFVIVSAGDPSCRTSPNEQDQRHLGPMLHLPLLDPSTPAEAHAMTRFAFELSEEAQLPVLLRPTTRVCHSRAVITYGDLREPSRIGFERDPSRWVPLPTSARKMRVDLEVRLPKAGELMAATDFFRAEGPADADLVVIASGSPAAVCADVIGARGLAERVRLVTVGTLYPIPEAQLIEQLKGQERVLVVEELSPYLEEHLQALCQREGLPVKILGKATGHFPVPFEYEPQMVRAALAQLLGGAAEGGGSGDVGEGGDSVATALAAAGLEPLNVPMRPPTLCPGCPHRSSYVAARFAFGDDQLFFNDIGCYTLGFGPPLDTADALLCMGAGFTLAAGVARVTGERTVGFLGDSTFFHSGMPALLNAIKERVNMVAVILDNQVTAMTGMQDSPMVGVAGETIGRDVSIEAVVRSLGAEHVETVDPYDLPATIGAFERAKNASGVSVVITERACRAYLVKQTPVEYKITGYEIAEGLCSTCGLDSDGMNCGRSGHEDLYRHQAGVRARDSAAPANAVAGVQILNAPTAEAGSAPCTAHCPLGLCVQGVIGHVGAGDLQGAWESIVGRIPLPESVCRVCHRPCEDACEGHIGEEALAVNDLKRVATQWAAREGVAYDPPRAPSSGKRVVVIGAGPSGLTAAHDLCILGHDVTLMDAEDALGGLLRSGIPAYRLPRAPLERDIQRILDLGVTFKGGQVLGRDVFLCVLLEELGYDAACVTTGAIDGLKLFVDGAANSPLVLDALSLLALSNRGLRVDLGDRVVVVGGGNAAIDVARTARRLGVGQVTIAYRRGREEMPALAEEIAAALEEGVLLETWVQPEAVVESGESVAGESGLRCLRTEPGEPDASGRSRPVSQPGSGFLIPADRVIVAIGQQVPQGLVAPADLPLKRDSTGAIIVEPTTGQSSDPRVFAAGDVAPGERTVTEAMAAGRRAAWGLDRHLRGGADQPAGLILPRPPLLTVPVLGAPAQTRERARAAYDLRQKPEEADRGPRLAGFDEVLGELQGDQIGIEAARCRLCGTCGTCRVCIDVLGCPAFFVDPRGQLQIDDGLCMGCGLCAALCPNGAIRPLGSLPDPAADDDEVSA